MGDLNLNGPLNLAGMLVLKDKVKVGGVEALVEPDAAGTAAAPVVLPPPPASPLDVGLDVGVIKSFNQTVKAGQKPLVALGLVMQGNTPTWPGMMLPSSVNTGASAVTVNHVAINVQGDSAIIFPVGASVTFSTSGQ
jgi:hypothetical protein